MYFWQILTIKEFQQFSVWLFDWSIVGLWMVKFVPKGLHLFKALVQQLHIIKGMGAELKFVVVYNLWDR